ncbi:hypothetical protein AT2G14289 [Arabidopsis thaliana]|uniref:Uncharacterized protein n=2 Tax=Arabidopsis thaliana TaxID=3702 RepID=A0A5S9WY26_ARATH|nr:uncharacterized protein AT2G14289 [Arabidopsis thaliana]AEC06299.1 hypothetical protein AT2G14289 [Arabidopsis thaliana]CAA0361289.1 unnamed protein product [Arabidopsis thaliana]|eukprot:NP_001118316.1 hypothetical protein AT2G14289 [Arabidopsis thaliana]
MYAIESLACYFYTSYLVATLHTGARTETHSGQKSF